MGILVAILFNGVELFEQYPFDGRLHVKSGENWSRKLVSEKKMFKDYMIKHVI